METVNQNKYQSKLTDREQNRYFEYLIHPSFQRVNRLFVLLFENRTDRKVHTKYHILKVELKDYNVIIDGKNAFDKPIKNALETCDNIRKIATGQIDDQITDCCPLFKEHYKLIAIDLSKQQKLDAEPKEIQKINFVGNKKKQTNRKNATIIFIIEEAKETVLNFSKGTIKVLWFYFVLFHSIMVLFYSK